MARPTLGFPRIRALLPLSLAIAVAGCATELADFEDGFEEGAPFAGADGKADGVELPGYAALPEGADLERPFTALFVPDDPIVTVELEMIRRVVDARRADAAVYEEGSNPFRIRYAVYNLRNIAITDALIAAEQANVDVTVLTEADQLDPARDYNTMDERFEDNGLEVVRSHRDLTNATRRTADMIGIAQSGLMHLKARLFETPAWSAVISGSFNPGDNAVMNEETFHLMREPRLVAKYAAAWDSVLAARRIDNTWDDGEAVNVLFTPAGTGPRAGRQILDWIAEEDEQILIMVFSLRNVWDELEGILARKVAEGVPVYVITDRKQSDGVDANGNHVAANDRTEDRLRAAGVHFYEATNLATEFTAMHHKVAILGRTDIRVITDAANWTLSGLGSPTRRASNVESSLFIDSSRLDGGHTGRRYMAQWMRVLSRYAAQSASDGEASYAEVRDRLTSNPDWPTEDVRFEAIAETSPGESVYVRGDIDALGRWGDTNRGVMLSTDAALYPTWQTEASVALPVGVAFAWKLTIQSPSEDWVWWENGGDRDGFVQGAAFSLGAPTLSARWR